MTEVADARVIGAIYDLPLAPDGWMKLATELERAFNASFALFLINRRGVIPVAMSKPLGEEQLNRFVRELWRQDRALNKLSTTEIGCIVRDSELVSSRDRATDSIYREFMTPNGLDLGLYASIAQHDDAVLVASARRSAAAGDYGMAEITTMQGILPHLQRSFRTAQRLADLEARGNAALDVVEHVNLGVAIVDEDGKLKFANAVAEGHFQQGALKVRDGRVGGLTRLSSETLKKAISAVATGASGKAQRVVLRDENGSPRSIMVRPLVAHFAKHGFQNAAVLIFGHPEARAIEPAATSQAFGLTPAESRLLAAIVAGERVAGYAARTGISVATAKTHLQALFEKTGEHRQVDLVRRAISDPVLSSGLA